MKRLIPRILIVVAIAWSVAASHAESTAPTATLATCWNASISAESQKKFDESLKQMQAYQQQGGDKFLTLMRTGWIYYLKADYAKASAFYLAASQLQPAAINPLLGQLNVAQAEADPAKIQMAADAVLRVEPSNYRAQMVQAGAYFAKPDYRKALSSYRRVLTYYPDDLDAASGEAWCSYYLSDLRQALRGFTKLLSINPDYPCAQQGFDLSGGKPAKATTQNSRLRTSTGLQAASGL